MRRLKSYRWIGMSLIVGVAILIAFVISQFKLAAPEAMLYDTRMQLRPLAPVSGTIATIAIDAKTVETLQRDPDAKDHLALLKILKQTSPEKVVYVADPSEIAGSDAELEAFSQMAVDFNVIAKRERVAIKGLESELQLKPPLDKMVVMPGPYMTDTKIFAKDNVARRLLFSFQGGWMLHPILAKTKNGIIQTSQYQGLTPGHESLTALIDFHPKGTYKAASFIDVLQGHVDPREFTDKIVLIGRDDGTSVEDYVTTPYSKDIEAMSILELDANSLDTLILNRAIVPSPAWLDFLITALISILTLFVVLTVRPAKGLLILAATIGLFTLISYIGLSFFQFSFQMSHPLLAVFICYYFFIPYRLIMENRKSWEYLEKNRLLSQVEELKSNFLRMMSHDLKTPLARIQGMTEVVLQKKDGLDPAQINAIETIHTSSEELSTFIASVLNLGRIESKEIKLQLKSKDINKLINQVVNKCEFLAREKNIQVILELEPLFSVKIDEDLIRQVLTNLVENAIKYSPENSKVLITTEEENGRILIQVADQGIGIPRDELDNIFIKFYRSRQVVHTSVKGSGLGLYLSHYFVELHRGKLSVESETNKGSTFTVDLPMDLRE